MTDKKTSKMSFLTTGITGWKLASKGFAESSPKYRRKQQWKIFFHASLHPQFASRWLTMLDDPNFEIIKKNRPRIYIKPFRVYMSTQWSKDQKVKVILDTYRFIRSRGGSFNQLITNERIDFINFKLKDEIECRLVIGYDFRYRKEGEIVFSLECDKLGGTITSAAFSFEEIEKGTWITRIGCVQGHSVNDLYSTKEIQKAFNGLRPKSFIVFVVQEFSRHLGFSSIYGAGDNIQAYRKKHAIHIHFLHAIPFDYDAFWLENDGQKNSDGWYKLPLKLIQKDMKDIKTTKRAVYRRRYEQLDALSVQIEEMVKTWMSTTR